jgi:hypothetical protein
MSTRPWPQTNSLRVAVEGATAKGVNWANIFWLVALEAVTPTTTQCDSYAENFYNAYNTHLFALLGKDANMLRCAVNFYGAQPTQIVGDYVATTAGGSSNDTEVDSLTCAVSWQIGATWRGGKPRTYLPALPTEAFADSNTLDSTFIANVLSGAEAFNTAVNELNITSGNQTLLSCMSFFSGNSPRANGTAFSITGALVHPRIDSMRRRLGKEVT